MISAVKSASLNPQSHLFNLRAVLFHSTPALDRRRQSYSHTPRYRHHPSSYTKRFHRAQSKKSFLRDVNAFTDLFQSWYEQVEDDDPSVSRGASWFKKDHGRSKQSPYQGHQGRGRSPWFFEEVDEDEEFVDIDRVFETIFGRRQHSQFSFTYEDNTRRSSSYGHNYWDNQHWRSRGHRSWRSRLEEEYEFEEESESTELDISSHRRALGLSASGPLKLEDVKNAYRACALKWHPDRHQGSSKGVAEEKFKLCSAAYQSLCNKLAVN